LQQIQVQIMLSQPLSPQKMEKGLSLKKLPPQILAQKMGLEKEPPRLLQQIQISQEQELLSLPQPPQEAGLQDCLQVSREEGQELQEMLQVQVLQQVPLPQEGRQGYQDRQEGPRLNAPSDSTAMKLVDLMIDFFQKSVSISSFFILETNSSLIDN
jgi:hypothetical protein